MIRTATKFDKTEIKTFLRMFRDESNAVELSHVDDSNYLDRLIDSILIGRGVIFIAEGRGMLAAAIAPSIWCEKTLILHEIAWFVRPEYRGTSVGARLFKAYIEHGRRLKSEGRIRYFTITKIDSSPDLKYQKHGFTKRDENWVQ